MEGPVPAFPECRHEDGCITCGDEAVAMRVLRLDADAGLGDCADADGARQTVELTLVDGVEVGDRVLVHAGTALLRLEEEVAR